MATRKPTQKQVYCHRGGGIKAPKKTDSSGKSKVIFERKQYKYNKGK